MGPLAVVVALSAAPRLAAQEPPPPPPPSPIEQALIERVCIAALEAAHDQCVGAKLTALRADFGRDLSRLSVADRRSLDDTCLQARTLEGRDAYIACIDGQLTKIRARMTKGRPAAAAAAASAAVESAPVAVAEGEPGEQRATSLVTILVGTTAGVLFAAGVAVLFLRSRREPVVPTNCGRCGAAMPESGSLCVACRREAAEEVRRASAERANQERAQDDVARREREELELREQQARFEEEERLRQQELARQREEEEERLRQDQEEEARRQAAEVSPAAVQAVQEEETGPWAVLGVARDAGPDEIYAAYQEAKAKYDPDFVSHLGSDAQEHFKNKALAIDTAYQQLMAALTSVA
jgi:flagellar biosynthesis GTPase FlhF